MLHADAAASDRLDDPENRAITAAHASAPLHRHSSGPGTQIRQAHEKCGLGTDAISGFGAGDRFATTSKIYDSDNDGRIRANASDRFVLPGTTSGPSSETTGTLKLVNATSKPITNISFLGEQQDHRVTYYVYGATGDVMVNGVLHF